MALKKFKPTSPGQRWLLGPKFEEVTKGDSKEKRRATRGLLDSFGKSAGRNFQGKLTVRHQAGGHKQAYRIIDFKRNKLGVPGKVTSIDYDPNRTVRIALITYVDGEKRYILAPLGLKVGDRVIAGDQVEPKPGNAMPIKNIPPGTMIHNIELQVGRGGQLVRSAGNAAQLMAKEGQYAQVRLPSGEVRRISQLCMATVGQLGNPDNENRTLGKAGRKRWLGKKPEVRGSAMTPRDHPHGGGEGKAPVGHPGPLTPWGKPALGYRTRTNKVTDRFIVKRRGK